MGIVQAQGQFEAVTLGNAASQLVDKKGRKVFHSSSDKRPDNRSYRLMDCSLVQRVKKDTQISSCKLAVSREEAALMLSVCVKTLDRLTSNGSIRSFKVRRRRIFSVEDILAWLQKNLSCQGAASTALPEASLPLTVTRLKAASVLSLGVRLFDSVVASGQIPKVQFSRKIVFRTSDLVRWLRNQPDDRVSE